ncbi:MAG: hypothetical protein IJS14_09690 [Lentisphaeria bacterium]|nr:hypothetical protein [Lentisphaeria bacterium]
MKFLLTAAGLIAAGVLSAAVQLPSLFSNHAVLARKANVPVFGKADPGEKVVVTFNGQQAETTAGADGRWRVALDLSKSPEGPFELKVNEITVKDVVVGEVWLCSGQSNMAFMMAGAIGLKDELKALPGPRMRCFMVGGGASVEPLDTCKGKWVYADAANLKFFSAVSYFFAKELLKNGVGPVGLIKSAQGGAKIESWMSEESLKELVPDAKEQAAKRNPKVKTFRIPLMMFNARLNPLVPYRLSGVIWYQGESNASAAARYAPLFRAMIQDWRKRFEDPDLPFYWCNLPAYRPRSNDPAEEGTWPGLRAAQTAVLDLPHTGQAVLIDTGETGDIHPRDKRPAGARLGALALNRVYGQKRPDCGPSVDKVVRDGSRLRITFRDATGGLKAAPVPEKYDIATKKGTTAQTVRNSPKTQLEGFALCGADGKWHWADEAVIDGDTVAVSSAAVPVPTGVKYAWQNSPVCNLYNGEGFPAVPFKCDAVK